MDVNIRTLALEKIARVADKILIHAFPVRDWDGKDFGDESEPAETGKDELRLVEKTRPAREGEPWIVHPALLDELTNAMLDLADIEDPDGKADSDELRKM